MRVFEAIAEQIRLAGVHDLFAYVSRDTCKMVAAVSALGLKVYHTRHEHTAVGMADGYWRAGGRVGIAVLGQGGGLTNATNALLTAARARSGTVVFIGEASGAAKPGPSAAKLMLKYIDQRGLLNLLNLSHIAVDSPDSAAEDVRYAIEYAGRTGTTVVVTVPEDVFESEAGNAPQTVLLPPMPAPGLSAGDKETILELLSDPAVAARTLILAGRGAVKSGARGDLLRLGNAIGALMGTTVMAKGFFEGEPATLGVVGTFATPLASGLLQSADLVLAFGASLNYHTTFMGQILGKARIIQFDTDPEALGRFQAVDMAVLADARLAAAALADALEDRGHKVVGYRSQETLRELASFRRRDTFRDRSTDTAVDNRTLMAELNDVLPPQRTLVVDAGNFMEAAIANVEVPDASGFLWPNEYGAVGCAIGNALGAAIARPERLAVLCVGDGGLMMGLGDLDTAVRYELPVLVIVCNDSALGAELHYLVEAGYSGDDARHENPSFEAVARSMGFEAAATITRIRDVRVLAEQFKTLRGPMLVDCRITDDPADFLSFQYALYRRLGKGEQQLVGSRGAPA